MSAERNRAIKKLLTRAFAPCKVRVHGHRGTAYGWVDVSIDYAPKCRDEKEKLEALIWKLFDANGIKIGTYGYDDPGSDYGFGNTISFNWDMKHWTEDNREQWYFGRCQHMPLATLAPEGSA